MSNRQRQIELATRAYHAGYGDDWPGAARWVEKLNAEEGAAGLTTAMLAWIDTAIAASGLDVSGPVRVAWTAAGSGEVQTEADKVRREARWAGRLLAARLADDEAEFTALLTVLNGLTPAEVGDHIIDLLRMCVLTIRQGRQSGRLDHGRGDIRGSASTGTKG